MYSIEEIKAAFETLKKIVEHETGLPVEQIPWSPDSMAKDIESILTKNPYTMEVMKELGL